MKNRGQSSIEFLIFIGIASLVFLTFIAIATSYLSGITKNGEILDVQDTARIIRNEINLASWVKGDYEKTIELPETINGNQYSLKIVDRELTIITANNHFVQPLATKVYSTGSNPIDINHVTPGQYIIKKENEIVTFNKKQ